MLIVYPNIAKESVTKLSDALHMQRVPSKNIKSLENTNVDVWNYGSTLKVKGVNYKINHPNACKKSTDKVTTLAYLKAFKIPAVEFTTIKKCIPKDWGKVVVRATVDGAENSGMSYADNDQNTIPDAPLYTRYYNHKFEFRVMVYNDKIICRYLKKRNDKNEWEFTEVDKDMFEKIDEACIKAVNVIGLNFAGVDVLSNAPDKFKVLEVNSAPIITDDCINFMKGVLNV